MSLSTQLARGTLAVPLMLLFVLLGFVEAPRAETAMAAASAAAPAELLQAVCRMDAGKNRAFVLAQAPGDLGRLVVHLRTPCRG
jgi:hypothetical protein